MKIHVKEAIDYAINRSGLSKAEFYRKSGYTRQNINVTRASNNITILKVIRICRASNIPVSTFVKILLNGDRREQER